MQAHLDELVRQQGVVDGGDDMRARTGLPHLHHGLEVMRRGAQRPTLLGGEDWCRHGPRVCPSAAVAASRGCTMTGAGLWSTKGRVHSAADSPAASAPPTRVRYTIVGLTLALIAVAYLDRVCIATAAPAMKADLGLSDTEMGLVFSAFTLAYALFEVPSGWFADRFGARVALTRIVLWWSAMTAATGLATGFWSLFAVRLLFGMGEAGAFPATARVYARWLPAAWRGRVFGSLIMAGALTGAITQPLVVALLRVVTWPHVFAMFGSIGTVWAVAWWIWFRDDPHRHPRVNAAEIRVLADGGAHPPAPHRRVPWRQLVRNRSLVALCLMYGGAIYGWYFYLTWLPTYLLRARGFELSQAGWLAALPLLAIGAGVFAGGWLSDVFAHRWGAGAGRRIPGVVGLPIAALAIIGAVTTTHPTASALLFAGAAGFAALGVSPAWAVCVEIGGIHSGVVSGAMNMFGNLGGALSPVVVGIGVDRWHSWDAPLLSVAAFYLFAAVCWLAVDPKDALALPE
jgi:MFS transporter, ACS family, glucarate transporter